MIIFADNIQVVKMRNTEKNIYWKYYLSEKKYADKVQCWQALKTNKIYDNFNFAVMGSELVLPIQKWGTGSTDGSKEAKRPLWKISLHFAMKNPGLQQKIEDGRQEYGLYRIPD